jgi:hypothetical protein
MSDWTHISGSRALIARAASLSVFIILGALVYFSVGPTAGQKQIDRTLEALKKVHSWRRRAEVRNPTTGDTQLEINEASCPLNSRRTIIINAGTPKKLQIESLRIGAQAFERFNEGPWTTNLSSNLNCADASGLLDFGSAPINYVRETGVITKGDKRLVDGVKCRDWKFSSQVPGRPVDRYTVCIDSDNLPREIRTADGEMVVAMSDFNSDITFIAPELPPPPSDSVVAPVSSATSEIQ